MRTPEQVIWDFVQDWLNKATQDFKTVEFLMKKKWDDYFNCTFHAQQAVEKYIKAYLVKNQVEFRKTHDLEKLLALIEKIDAKLASNLRFSEWLTDFAVGFRYPEEPSVDEETAKKAMSDMQKVKKIIMNILNEYLSNDRPE